MSQTKERSFLEWNCVVADPKGPSSTFRAVGNLACQVFSQEARGGNDNSAVNLSFPQ